MNNLFPNSQWQLWTALGPGWDGGAAIPIGDHLSSYETEQNWAYSGNLPSIVVSEIKVSTDTTSGQVTVTATGDNNVQYLYPGSLIVFADGAHSSLRLSPIMIRAINYTNKTFSFYAIRNIAAVPGAVSYQCRPVMRCDRVGVTGNGPDGWTKNVGAFVWPDRWPEIPPASTSEMIFLPGATSPNRPGWTNNQRPTTKRLLVFEPRSSGDAYFYHQVPDYKTLRGRTVVWGMWVQRVSAGTGRLFVNDGAITKSSMSVTSGAWTWLEMTWTLSTGMSAPPAIGFVAENSNSAQWRIAEPRLDYGASLGVGNYVRPKGCIERFIVKYTPDSYYGAELVFGAIGSTHFGWGHTVDPYGETGGAISEDAVLLFSQLEFTADAAGRALSIRNDYTTPQRFGPAPRAPVSNGVACDSGPIEVALDGTFWLYSNSAGATPSDVSIDINQAVLW